MTDLSGRVDGQGRFSEEDAFSPHRPTRQKAVTILRNTLQRSSRRTSIIVKSSTQGGFGFSEAATWGEVVVLFCSLLMSCCLSCCVFNTSGDSGFRPCSVVPFEDLLGEMVVSSSGPIWTSINLWSEFLATSVVPFNWKPPWLLKPWERKVHLRTLHSPKSYSRPCLQVWFFFFFLYWVC